MPIVNQINVTGGSGGVSVPDAILLDHIKYNPVTGRVEVDSPVTFDEDISIPAGSLNIGNNLTVSDFGEILAARNNATNINQLLLTNKEIEVDGILIPEVPTAPPSEVLTAMLDTSELGPLVTESSPDSFILDPSAFVSSVPSEEFLILENITEIAQIPASGKVRVENFIGSDDTGHKIFDTVFDVSVGTYSFKPKSPQVFRSDNLYFVKITPVGPGNLQFKGLTIDSAFVSKADIRGYPIQRNKLTTRKTAGSSLDNYLRLNDEYTTTSGMAGGLIQNYLPTSTTDIVTAGQFTPGVAGTSNPTVATIGAATFAAGKLVQFKDSNFNNGIFEVVSHAANLLTVRGVGTIPTVDGFTRNNFINGVDSAVITEMGVSVIRAGIDGIWETASGSSAGMAFNDLANVNDETFTGTTTIQDLIVSGTRTINNTINSSYADNHLNLNSGYTTVIAQTGGLVVNYLPTSTVDSVSAGAFTAGVDGVSNPTVATVGTAIFSAGQLVQLSLTNTNENDGVFEVLSHSANLLTIKGIGNTATIDDFTQNQFVTNASDSATITAVSLSVMRAGTDGKWEQGNGDTSGLTFEKLLSISSVGTVTTPVTNQPLTLDPNGTGAVIVLGALYARGGGGQVDNTVIGQQTMTANSSGGSIVAIGFDCLNANTTEDNNTAGGRGSLKVATAAGNTAWGYKSGFAVTLGINNCFFGKNSGLTTTTGSNLILIGDGTVASSATASNETVIGNAATTLTTLHGGLIVDGSIGTVNTNQHLNIEPNGTGMVGFGTDVPEQAIHLLKDVAGGSARIKIQNPNVATNSQASFELQQGTSGSWVYYAIQGEDSMQIFSQTLATSVVKYQSTGAIEVFGTIGTIGANKDLTLSPNGTGDVIINSTAKLGVGTQTPNAQLTVAVDATNAPLSLDRYSTTATQGSYFLLRRSKGGTIGTDTVVVDGDNIGGFFAQGWSGANYLNAGAIQTEVDGTVADGFVPGRLVFKTANSAGSLTAKMTIGANGNVTFTDQILASFGTESLPGISFSGDTDTGIFGAAGSLSLVTAGSAKLTVGPLGVTLNEGAAPSFDFRVESDTNTHMLFVDAGTNKVGINTDTPGSEFEVNGFTKLGSGAPSIKMKKLTGTTNASEGGNTDVAHGLTDSKILAISVLVDMGSNTFLPPGGSIAGQQYDARVFNSGIRLINHATESETILSKAFTVLITYEE